MSRPLVDQVPDSATTVLVLSPAIDSDGAGEVCAGVSARAKDVLVVGYAGADASGLRHRLEERTDGRPSVDELEIGTDVDPNDLTGLGIAIAESVAAGTEVCFDSLTALLQYADRERSFQFLHSLGERCAAASTSVHYHLDPEAADEQTVTALSTLMDAVVDTGAGEVRVRAELQKD